MSLASLIGRALRGLRAGGDALATKRVGGTGAGFALTSEWFADGGAMPPRSAGEGVGGNVSPPLAWEGAPDATQSFALIVQDVDAPTPKPIVHLIAYGLPGDTRRIEEGALRRGSRIDLGQGTLGVGYHGPRPVKGHGVHRYVFQLFALANKPSFDRRPKLKDLLAAIEGQVLGTAVLTGTYERR